MRSKSEQSVTDALSPPPFTAKPHPTPSGSARLGQAGLGHHLPERESANSVRISPPRTSRAQASPSGMTCHQLLIMRHIHRGAPLRQGQPAPDKPGSGISFRSEVSFTSNHNAYTRRGATLCRDQPAPGKWLMGTYESSLLRILNKVLPKGSDKTRWSSGSLMGAHCR